MKLCSKCNERPAVVFITRVEGDKSYPEGFCLKCARELNIGPINDMLNSMNLPEETMAELNESISDMMEGIIDEETGEIPTIYNTPIAIKITRANTTAVPKLSFNTLFADFVSPFP